MIIKSTNFNVDKNGDITCNGANMNNIQINGGNIILEDSSGIGNEFQITSTAYRLTAGSSMFKISGKSASSQEFIHLDISESSEPNIIVSNNNNRSVIKGSEIRTPKLTQTSLESIKKNISIYNENALETILNSDIYTYNLKSEKDTDSKHIGFVIGEKYRTPKEIINNEGNAVELYSAIGILWKAVQELSARVEQLEKEARDE